MSFAQFEAECYTQSDGVQDSAGEDCNTGLFFQILLQHNAPSQGDNSWQFNKIQGEPHARITVVLQVSFLSRAMSTSDSDTAQSNVRCICSITTYFRFIHLCSMVSSSRAWFLNFCLVQANLLCQTRWVERHTLMADIVTLRICAHICHHCPGDDSISIWVGCYASNWSLSVRGISCAILC